MKQMKQILSKNKKSLIPFLLFTILVSMLAVVAGYSLGWIIDACEAEGNRVEVLFRNTAMTISVWLVFLLADVVREWWEAKQRIRLKNDLRGMATRKIASVEYSEFAAKDSGAYVSWLSNDVDQLYTNSFEKLFRAVSGVCNAIFAFVVMSSGGWYIGATALALFSLLVITPKLFEKKLQEATKNRSEALEKGLEAYKDTVMGAGIFYLNNLRQRIVERIENTSMSTEQRVYRSNVEEIKVGGVLSIVNILSQCAIIAAATLATILGGCNIGLALSMGNLAGVFFNGVKNATQSIISLRASKPLWEKFQTVQSNTAKKETLPAVDCISMENISFAYGEKAVLKNKSFCFEQGRKYAIVGESGSGKSTVLKLLMGLLPDYEGSIFYNDTEQKQSNLSSLYEQVAYVDQQVYLFQDSLRFNITLGADYSEEEIMATVKACKLESLLEALPHGLDSQIAENGKNLSGGQCQRIALARGFIRKVHYILMDEGTSALDEENALDIEESLMEQKEMGVIIITHNLHDSVKRQLNRVYQL